MWASGTKPPPPRKKRNPKKIVDNQERLCFLTPHRDALRYFGGILSDSESEGEAPQAKNSRVAFDNDEVSEEELSSKEIRIIHTLDTTTKTIKKASGKQKGAPRPTKRCPYGSKVHIKDVLEAVRQDGGDGLIYMNYALPVDHKDYNPFTFRIVNYSDINKEKFLNVSKNGVIIGGTSQPLYYSLDNWEKQYDDYVQLAQFRSFKYFLLYKYLVLWHKKVSRKRYVQRRNALESRLLLCRSELREAIMKARGICCTIGQVSFFTEGKQETMTLQQFLDLLIGFCSYTFKSVLEGHTLIKQLLNVAAHGDMLKLGIPPEETKKPEDLMHEPSPVSSKMSLTFAGWTPKKISSKISYADALKKKNECKKITGALCLADYLVQTSLIELLHNSIDKFLSAMEMQMNFLPDESTLTPDSPLDEIIEAPRETQPKVPRFLILLLLVGDDLEFEPSGKAWETSFRYIVNMWLKTVAKVKPLQGEQQFDVFTKPMIGGFQEDPLCGFGPKISETIKNDLVFNEKSTKLVDILRKNFNYLIKYIQRFETVRQKTVANINLDRTIITDETGLESFKRMLLAYIEDRNIMSKILLSQFLGAFMVNLEYFREDTYPLVENLEELVKHTMAKLGVERVNEALAEVMNALEYLGMKPQTTANHVEYLAYLDTLIPRMDEIGYEIDYLDELYSLMELFNVELGPGDARRHKNLGFRYSDLQEAIEKALATRPDTVVQFNDTVAKDIDTLMGEIASINKKATESWLVDINSDEAEVMKTLQMFTSQLQTLLENFEQFNNYQRHVKVPVTRLDPLLDVINEVKIRKLLWESLDNWEKTEHEWMSCDFEDLDPEVMQQEIAVFAKNIVTITKIIGPNELVAKLKSRVDNMSSKLPVITTLRNPNLKLRHWMRIEETIGYRFDPGKVITLTLFDELNVYQYETILAEISGQASSEAALEALLKKVEDAWKSLEFVVLPYKDMKDIYILARVEEIQTVLDETNINLTTITSSKNVGPIKARVMDWLKNVELFSKTLEEWMACQTNWMYLEPIFSAPDIQRQLPAEARLFFIIDKSWKQIMKNVAKNPLAMKAATSPGLYEAFKKNNEFLEQILKCLEAYLESKRVVFPRFYFLSNDELLEILAQTRNPHAVQPHLRKCFDAISKLEFGFRKAVGDDQAEKIPTNDIKAMISPEGEVVQLGKGLKARGNVEEWLGQVEASMFHTLWLLMKMCIKDYLIKARVEWVINHASQLILTVSQIMWARGVHAVLTDKTSIADALLEFEKKSFDDLNDLAAMVRGDLTKLQRNVLGALITVDVHARDIISSLVTERVRKVTNFEWAKQLRYYWDMKIDNCVACMATTRHIYGYEYLGASGRLVITPLTDKCYLCLMGALQLDLGGAPAGPAGTGKTETTKDLAKSLAIQCVVFNCSEGLDYKMMGRFFSGLAQSGAWCCFDEFNRIDIEVLSVIAQQLITIRNAKVAKVKRFMFEGREIKLIPSCAAFITMNPGYAGRTELPDNLKSVFRPMAMMVPDYGLIAEVILYSEGFETSKILAQKMVNMYKLCSEQLSSQDHYDFGMRAVKSVLVMAGSLKRQNPDKKEDIVLIRALRDSNLPKFLAGDAILFGGILNDLFPGAVLPVPDYGQFQKTMEAVLEELKLQPAPVTFLKTIQLYETMVVRWGVMTVGPTAGGKTSVLRVLEKTLTTLHANGAQHPQYRPVTVYTLNPKSITMGELYGEVNLQTMEWRDGLLGIFVRSAANCTEERHQWVVCDGPVDAVWIENMNTVLDDNKMLCLANSERIKLTPWVHMVFEVQDLSQASPATVSRCGMVYMDPEDLRWMPYVVSWAQSFKAKERFTDFIYNTLIALFEEHVDSGFAFMKKNCKFGLNQVEVSKIAMLCSLLEYLVSKRSSATKYMDVGLAIRMFHQVFIFSFVWALGGNLVNDFRSTFEQFCKEQFKTMLSDIRFDLSKSLWDIYYDPEDSKLKFWVDIVGKFVYNKNESFTNMIVPTVDMVRCGQLLTHLLEARHPVLLIGHSGVGKSAIVKQVLNDLAKTELWVPNALNFSAQTSSTKTQEIIEGKLEKKKRAVLGAPMGKRVIVFVDDVNMPKPEIYGAQPPIELLREFLNFGGMYDREKLFWKQLQNVVLCAACAPPGGGRNQMTARFTRHFAMLFVPSPSDISLTVIIKSILQGFLDSFGPTIQALCDGLVSAAITVYKRLAQDLLPIPAKSHYVFNLRDLSKCVQGMLQASADSIRSPPDILRLFFHENLRVYHDRLIDVADKSYFYRLLSSTCTNVFQDPVLELPPRGPITPPLLLFGDFISQQPKETRTYQEMTNIPKLKSVLQDYQADYNLLRGKNMNLIFFTDALDHVCRLARILRTERGNGLLVGVGGMGKRSLTKLASHINGCRDFQIEITSNYDYNAFHEDLRKIYFNAGAKFEDTVFLFSDTQIVQEEFLEDVNNILNSGEISNLFESDDYERVIIACRSPAKHAGLNESHRDTVYDFFISRVKAKLHLMLCMSPVGDAFRRRCRMFPSLVNCCTINWFTTWPEEALLSVAKNTLSEAVSPDQADSLASICYILHSTVEAETVRFYKELKRRYYVTPSSYLDLLDLFKTILKSKANEVTYMRNRISNGQKKLFETNSLVSVMQKQLVTMEPELREKSKATDQLMVSVAKEKAAADEAKQVVLVDEAAAKEVAAECQLLADDAQKDLDQAMPAMEAAVKALEALNKNDINEIRVFNKPPHLVKYTLEAVCLLLGAKQDWATAKVVLGDGNFLKKLQDYDKNHISEMTLKKLKSFIDNPDFVPEVVATQSKACKSLCMWVRAIDSYAKVYRVVEPKRRKVDDAEKQLNSIMAVLRSKQQHLANVEAQIARLEARYDKSLQEKSNFEAEMALCGARLNRAFRLTSALADEEVRWGQLIVDLEEELAAVVGDSIVASGCVAYLGPFSSEFRTKLVARWLSAVEEMKIKVSNNFSLIQVLSDPYIVREWNRCGLPRNNVSIENGIFVTKTSRWPLMIDPQEQALRWIRQMEAENNLKTVKMTDATFMRQLESAVRLGLPVLVVEAGETLDPSLNPIISKQIFTQGGRLLIRWGEMDMEYDPKFKLYITTKLPNPHYLPEICIQVAIINFTVTPSGLEDQLLVDVVTNERPDLEEQRTELIVRINKDKAQLLSIEDKILKLLFASHGNILDDEELIETLNESKETSAVISSRLAEAEETEEKISIAREAYRSVATRGSSLYFVIAQLADIDPMYQFSLKYFSMIFNTVIKQSPKMPTLEERLAKLRDDVTLTVFSNVSRGLFEKDKLVYSFMLCLSILKEKKEIAEDDWQFLLRGAIVTGMDIPRKPDVAGISDYHWQNACYLDIQKPNFKGLKLDLTNRITITVGDYTLEIALTKDAQPSANDWNSKLDPFQRMMLIKALKEEKLIFAIREFIKIKMGVAFVESTIVNLHTLYEDTNKLTPLIFVLSSGSDPVGAFLKFAAQTGNADRVHSISLGQGQGPIAQRLIDRGQNKGEWVFLQNCHLAASWMPTLENIMMRISEYPNDVNEQFRLFMSSMPSSKFPVSVLQNSVKATNEPPKGIRANVRKAFLDMEEEFFNDHPLDIKWRKMVFGLCFFHAIILERKKFGPLGWNIGYEFSESDRECALLNLKLYCQSGKQEIPWDALIYITGEITYGGRVTDYWDQRTLKTILVEFFSNKTLADGYRYLNSETYRCPESEDCTNIAQYRLRIAELPLIEDPEVFGMHENANIALQTKETAAILRTIMSVQPQTSTESEGESSETVAFEMASQIREKIAKFIDPSLMKDILQRRDSKGRLASLSTVILHEIDRFNKLLSVIHSSLGDLQKAIKGTVVMSESLEGVYTAFLTNMVPNLWSKASYPSLKMLASWTRDLELRVDFITTWLKHGLPQSFWLPGFFFPQGFMTGVLQTHARKYELPIDELKIDFVVTPVVLSQELIFARHLEAGKESPEAYKGLEQPEDGMLIHGLFLDAARFDTESMRLENPNPGEINPPLPALHLSPSRSPPKVGTRYECPLYKTSARAGTLSTTGHSTNFVITVLLPSAQPQSSWILKGTALLTQITD